MAYEVSVYSVMYAMAAVVTAVVASFVWRRRDTPGAMWLFLMMMAMVWRTTCDAMDVSAVAVSTKVFWGQMSYVGSMAVPVFLLMFTFAYTGRRRWITPRNVALLFVVPVLSLVAVSSNSVHHLVWSGFSAAALDPRILIYHHGPLFWVIMGYVHVLVLTAAIMLVARSLETADAYGYQALALIAAMFIPWVAELVYDFVPDFLPGLDVVALVFPVSAVILAVSIWRGGLLDLVPIARQTLVETMDDGLLVMDPGGRIVDINPAAARTFHADHRVIGRMVDEALAAWPSVATSLKGAAADGGNERMDLTIVASDGRHLALKSTPIMDESGRPTGTLTVMRDVTDHVMIEGALHEANEELRARLEEIEHLHTALRQQALHDPLTGLYNRRYLDETLEREFARATRDGHPISVIMMDIDHFKEVNDNYGHAAGDLVLELIGRELRERTRSGDVACRYGGEEFVIVLPDTSVVAAYKRAEELRAALERAEATWMEDRLAPTFSLGVAAFPVHGASPEAVLAAADAALYQAKSEGRNRSAVFRPRIAGVSAPKDRAGTGT